MTVYYNENDPFAAAWLRELIAEGLIPAGDVDERSIKEVRGDDLHGYDQHHFFAGIGGWAYALRLAGWPDDRPVWTGSCPCQPFSQAGKRKGHADERHLWPEFLRLIIQRRPPVIFGEQVASKDGRLWLSGVRADLEALEYAVGAADLCAAGIGAPHIRQRLFWVADAAEGRRGSGRLDGPSGVEPCATADRLRGVSGLGHPGGARLEERAGQPGHDGAQRQAVERTGGGAGGLADAVQPGRPERRSEPGNGSSPWGGATWLPCLDGKARRVEPGIFPVAHGISNRMGTLRGAGNAIVPQVAAEFIGARLSIDVFR